MENASEYTFISTLPIFGVLPDGRKVHCHQLTNSNGLEMKVINYGAIITSLKIPVGDDKIDVVLGFDTIEDYIESQNLPAPPHFGAVIGRFAGRIKDGRFSIGSTEHQLNRNNGLNTLHGGNKGWDKVIWDFVNITPNSLTLLYESADGEENFPGNTTVYVTYSLTDENEVLLEYRATSDSDTIINMTQHSYFNLDGHHGSIIYQKLQINSDTILEIDSENIPSGDLIKASEKGFDFQQAKNCPLQIDDSFIIADKNRPAAKLYSSKTSISMTVTSDQPSLHIYVGGDLFGKLDGKNGVQYHRHSGICFESQNYTDAPNHRNFPSAILQKGDIYRQKTIWKFDVGTTK